MSALYIIVLMSLMSCKGDYSTNGFANNSVPKSSIESYRIESSVRPYIGGHLGQDTIIGNFTGLKVDSIWMVERVDTLEDGIIEYNYYTASNNPLLPSVELYGRSSRCAFIVNEGDLTGDGKDEWAWMRGAFKSGASVEYHILHFEENNWKEFIIDLDGDTRKSGIDIVRQGSIIDSIIVSCLYWSEEPSDKVVGYDPIFNPFRTVPIMYGE